jgi:hypothetical protein
VPAVLDRPDPVDVQPRGEAQQLLMAVLARRDGQLVELSPGDVDGHDGVRVLMRIDPDYDHC